MGLGWGMRIVFGAHGFNGFFLEHTDSADSTDFFVVGGVLFFIRIYTDSYGFF